MKKITFVFMNMDCCNDDTNLTLTLTDPHDACETVFGKSGTLCILAVSEMDKSSAAEEKQLFRHFPRRKAATHAQTKDFGANLRSRFEMD